MTHTIRFPIRSLSAEAVQDLKEKYPEAEISVELHQDRNPAPMSEQAFWEIIGLLDWSKEGEDDDAVIEPAVSRLTAGPVRQIFDFADLLSEKLYTLDGLAYAQHIGEDAWVPDRYFSVDNFLYARCCTVANGRVFYEKALKNPSLMPKDLTFETLLYIPSEAYERKTGRRYDYSPAYSVETYSNKQGWPK